MMTAHRTRDATLLLASTLTVMAGATIAPALPEMERAYAEHEHAKLLVQLVMTLPGLLIALGAPVVGWLLDRGPRRPVLLVAMVLYALAGTSPLVLDGLTAILVGRALLGLAVAAIMVTCTTLVGDYFEGPQRGHAMGLLAAFGGFGGVVFVALGSALAGLHWRAPFALYGLAFLLVPAILAFLPEPTRPTVARPRGRGARISPVFLLGCCGLAILEILALYMVPVHVPFFAEDARITTHARAGLGISAMLLVMALVSGRYRTFQTRMGHGALHAGGIVLVGLGFAFLAHATTAYGALVALLVLGAGLGIMRPNLVTWLLSRTPPETRGRALGLVMSCFFLGQFLCPLLTQPVVEASGYRALFLGAGAIVGLPAAAACLLFAARRRTERRIAPP